MNTLFLSSDHHAAMVRASTGGCVEVKPADALVKKATAQRIVFARNVSSFNCYLLRSLINNSDFIPQEMFTGGGRDSE